MFAMVRESVRTAGCGSIGSSSRTPGTCVTTHRSASRSMVRRCREASFPSAMGCSLSPWRRTWAQPSPVHDLTRTSPFSSSGSRNGSKRFETALPTSTTMQRTGHSDWDSHASLMPNPITQCWRTEFSIGSRSARCGVRLGATQRSSGDHQARARQQRSLALRKRTIAPAGRFCLSPTRTSPSIPHLNRSRSVSRTSRNSITGWWFGRAWSKRRSYRSASATE